MAISVESLTEERRIRHHDFDLNEPFFFVNVVASCISVWWLKADEYNDNPSKLHWRKSLSLGFEGLIAKAMKIILDIQKF